MSNNQKSYFYEESKKIPNTSPVEIRIDWTKMQQNRITVFQVELLSKVHKCSQGTVFLY